MRECTGAVKATRERWRGWIPCGVLIIDTFNVLHAAPEADPRLGGLTLDGLARMLAAGRYGSLECVLVCDGTGGGKAREVDSSGVLLGNVRARFAGPGRDADTAIEDLLDEEERKRTAHRCTVVSSDKRLKAAAAGVRARWMSSHELVKQLVDDALRAQKHEADRTGHKPAGVNQGLDADSAAYWLRTFGFAPGTSKPRTPPGPAGPASAASSGPATPTPEQRLAEQIRQEWGERVDPDDLNMGKWLDGGAGR